MTTPDMQKGRWPVDKTARLFGARIAAGLVGLLLLALLIGLAVRWIGQAGAQGPMDVQGAEGTLLTFVQAIHDGDPHVLHELLADEEGAGVSSAGDLGHMAETEAVRLLKKYEGLDICEFQFGDHSMLTARGLIYHDHETSLFVSTMSLGNEGSWRVHDFEIQADVGPDLQARCGSEVQ